MNMEGADKKRIREEQELSPPEDSCRQKQARSMEFEAGMAFDRPDNASAGNENLPELLKDPWSWEDSAGLGIRTIASIRKQSYIWDYFQESVVDNCAEKHSPVQYGGDVSSKREVAEQPVEDKEGFGIRSIAAIRKQSYIWDYLQDSAVDNCTQKRSPVQYGGDVSSKRQVAEQQMEEKDCLRLSLFEGKEDQLWRPQSPLWNVEGLFSPDAMGHHECTTTLQDESIAQGAASYFRIWEQDDDYKDEKIHADDISFVYESEASDRIWGVPSKQSQFSESVEFESSIPSL